MRIAFKTTLIGVAAALALGTGAAHATPATMMYAAKTYGSGSDRGDIVTLDRVHPGYSFTRGNPAGGDGITGLDFDNQGRLWGSTLGDLGTPSSLIQVDPTTGGLVSSSGVIHTNAGDVAGSAISIGDLAYDQVTSTLYGIQSLDYDGIHGGNIYTIDLGTGLASLVGPTIWGGTGGIAFDSSGTLYAIGYDPNVGPFGTNMLFTLDPNDASELTRVTVSRNEYIFDGLGIDPLTGQIYAVEDDYYGSGYGTGDIYLVDPTTGTMSFVGKPSGIISDIAFRVPEPGTVAVLGLGLLGLCVTRRRRAG